MRRSTLPATILAVGLLLFGGLTLQAQPGDPYPALSRGAIDYAMNTASANANATDLYLTTVNDYGGIQVGFTLDSGASAAWGYQFYSPSRDSNYVVVVASSNNVVFGTLGAGSFPQPGDAAPAPLDTTGAFAQSNMLASLLVEDPGFQGFMSEHPNSGIYVTLTMLPDPLPENLPPGFPTDEAVWMIASDRFGDSVHNCFVATKTGTLDCGIDFYQGVPYAAGSSNGSSIAFGVTNFGFFGGDIAEGAASFEAPLGSGNVYIFGAGLWFGARKRIDGSLQPRVFITYNPNIGQSWATPGEGYEPRNTYSYPVLFGSGGYDQETGQPLSSLNEFNWPLWVTSPDTASMMNPGDFVGLQPDRQPAAGLRPAFVPSVSSQFVARYHDALLGAYDMTAESNGFPLGLQFQENVYSEPGGLDNTVIVSYMVINKSDDTLYDATLGMVTDFDIGNAGNDRSRFYSQRPDLRTALAWAGNEAGRATPYGILTMTLIEAPVTGDGGVIAADQRASYRTSGEVNTYSAWTLETDPATSAERYTFMTSGAKATDTRAADLRGMLSSETFTMLPGDTAHFAVGYIVNRDLLAIAGADPTLETRLENLMNVYYGLAFSGVRDQRSATGGLTIAAAPNPARDVVALRVTLATPGSATAEIYDHMGARVATHELGDLDAGTTVRTVGLDGLASGAYVVVVRSGDERVSTSLFVAR